MHRTFLLALSLTAGCSGPDLPRVPPLSVGGGGVRMMNEARTPAEVYENAFAALTGCHNRVRAGLGRGLQANYLDAEAALEEIAESLRVMRALVVDDRKAEFDPFIADYAGLAVDVGRGRPPANWQTRLDQGERDIKGKFAYAQAPIVAEWPPGMKPATEAADRRPKPAAPEFAPRPPPAATSSTLPNRLAFKAWKQCHQDLLSAFQGGRDAGSAYEDVRSAIAAMKRALPAARHAKLDLMLAVYEQQHDETKGFSTVPAHGSKALIRKQLDVVKETLETEYDPDRK